jgi:hypothetical protein
MSTTPPDEQSSTTTPPLSTQPGGGYGGIGRTPVSGAILPVPGNAELAVWLLAEIVLAIVAGISSRVDAHDWAIATTWLTAAYILSRGVAKASRVLEQ